MVLRMACRGGNLNSVADFLLKLLLRSLHPSNFRHFLVRSDGPTDWATDGFILPSVLDTVDTYVNRSY